jgi:D-alanyl-D-alanine dipeptidase
MQGSPGLIEENFFNSPEFLEDEKKFLEKNKLVKITKNDDVIIEVSYATQDNFCNKKLYSHPFIYCHEDVYESLKILVENLKKENLKLKIFDGFRPYKVQAFMAEKFPNFVDDGYVSHPIEGIATHVRGIAIDLTLVKDEIELDMGTAFDSMLTKSNYIAEGLTEIQITNRKLLKDHMIKAGFEGYKKEWWHFNLKIFNLDKDGEIIGALEETHKKYPKILEDFSALCSKEINDFYKKNTPKYPTQTTAKSHDNKGYYSLFYNALNSFKKNFTSNARQN